MPPTKKDSIYSRMTDFVPEEIATPIRVPSTANLCVDSADRRVDLSGNYPEPVWSFLINRPNSLLNGFFTRVGLTELALRWDTPNISSTLGNNTILLDISGYGSNPITLTFPNQFCGTAADVLDGIRNAVNDLSGTTNFFLSITTGQTFSGTTRLRQSTYQLLGNNKAPGTNGGFYRIRNTPLALQMNLFQWAYNEVNNKYTKYYEPTSPDLRPFYYIDFVSPQLTYNQSLKDATTNEVVVDVLTRFYFSYSAENTYDKYNYPILMGYKPFVIRETYNPPKQIKWSANQPIGQIAFQVYGQPVPQDELPGRYKQYGLLNIPSYLTNYQLTLQVSEV